MEIVRINKINVDFLIERIESLKSVDKLRNIIFYLDFSAEKYIFSNKTKLIQNLTKEKEIERVEITINTHSIDAMCLFQYAILDSGNVIKWNSSEQLTKVLFNKLLRCLNQSVNARLLLKEEEDPSYVAI